MTDKKYALYPGFVTSEYDGERHYITASRLATLYGVDMDKCIVIDTQYDKHRYNGQLIDLKPRKNGDYDLEKVEDD